MIFLHPLWLPGAFLAACVCAAFYLVGRRLRQFRMESFLSVRDTRAAMCWSIERNRVLSAALIAAGLASLFCALARPLTGPKKGESETRGIEAYVALDVSRSMLADDVPPNRLQFAKDQILRWRDSLPGGRVGLILFAGDAFVQMPPTQDSAMFRHVLENASPRSAGQGGTNIKRAIEIAGQSFAKRPVDAPILLLVTDGEQLEDEASTAAAEAAAKGLKTFALGVGTPEGTQLRSLSPSGRPGPILRDAKLNPIFTRLDETALKAITSAGGGEYVRLEANGDALETLQRNRLAPLAQNASRIVVDEYDEWFVVPLLFGLCLLLAEPFVRSRKTLEVKIRDALPAMDLPPPSENPASPSRKSNLRDCLQKLGTLGLFVILVGTTSAHSGEESADVRTRMESRLEQNPQDWEAVYNLGVLSYREREFTRAIEYFLRVSGGASGTLRDRATAQLANATVRQAEINGGPRMVPALADALAKYDRLEGSQLAEEAAANRKNTFRRFEEISLDSAEQLQKQADQEAATERQAFFLKRALEALTPLLALEADHEQAHALRKTIVGKLAATLVDTATQQERKANAAWTADNRALAKREQGAAIEILENAANLAPANPAITERLEQARVKLADWLIQTAESTLQSTTSAEKLESALIELDEAKALNGEADRIADLKNDIVKKIEEVSISAGDKAAGRFETNPDPTQAASHLQSAVGHYEKALEFNPLNDRALGQLAKLKPLLGESFEAMANKELTEAEDIAKNLESKPDNAGFRKALVHLEKAKAGFDQAEALGVPPERLGESKARAAELLEDLRGKLEELAAKNATENAARREAPPKKPGEAGEGKPPKMGSFSDVRRKSGTTSYSQKAAEQGRDW